MTKFIVIKGKYIINSFIFIIVLFTLLFFFLITEREIATTTFSLTAGESISCDFNGDGKDENLEVIDEKGNYILKIKDNNTDYILKTKDGNSVIGNCLPNWNIKITLKDLSRDGIPEIIVQSNLNSTPTNYLFTWIDDDYKNIYTSQDNILGILDSTNSRTPKLLSLSSKKGDSSTNSIILNSNEVKDITFSNTTVPGLASIQSFIDLIETPYELDVAPDIFIAFIDSSELSILWNLDKETYSYSFQNGFFTDTTWSNDGELTSLQWILSFENTNKLNNTAAKEELLLYLTIEKDSYNNFKISSIRK